MSSRWQASITTEITTLKFSRCEPTNMFKFSKQICIEFDDSKLSTQSNNSMHALSPLSAAYMHQCIGSALVQILKNHNLNQCWVIIKWTLRNKLQWNFDQNTTLFIHENVSENIVCEMAAMFSRGDELTGLSWHVQTGCCRCPGA